MVADRAPRNDWEWYFLMQHFRAPTRLLDWTDSAFVALYFAITSWKPASAKKKAVPAVWALNPFTLNWETIKKWGAVGGSWKEAQPYLPEVYRDAKLPKYPIAIDPELTAQRMVVQRSHFTIHGSDMRSMEEMREDLRGNVLKLHAKGNFYRLRVGNFRVLFLLAGDAIQVYAVKDRKEAYE